MLNMQHLEVLPPGNKLPGSYCDIMKLMEPFLIQPILFHACLNDCIVFRGAYTDLNTCPTCNASRYVKQGVPAKRFSYLPVGPRLARLLGTSSLSKIIQAHGLNGGRTSPLIHDIHEASAWTSAYSSEREFASDSRGISSAMNTDDVNPYSQNRMSYSMWPINLTVLNLPRNIRNVFGNFWLVGTVPGNGNKEPNSLDPYLDILVDELLAISNKEMFDAYQGARAPFNLKVDILMYVLDYPGISKVFNILGANAYQACAWCEIEGKHIFIGMHLYVLLCSCLPIVGTYFSELHKMTYLDSRRFLPFDSSLRKDSRNYPSKSEETRPAPSRRVYSIMKDVHTAYYLAKTK